MVRLKNADGNKAIFGFRYVDDILAEEEREKEILSAQTKLETMAEAIHGGFKLSKIDDRSTFVMVSEQFSDMLWFDSPQELMNCYPTMLGMIHPEDEKREIDRTIESIRMGDMYTMHFRIRCKDGKV